MELIVLVYSIAALSTGILATYKFYVRALNEALFLGSDNAFTQSPIKGGLVFLIIATLTAPALIVPVLLDTVGDRFYESFKDSVIA